MKLFAIWVLGCLCGAVAITWLMSLTGPDPPTTVLRPTRRRIGRRSVRHDSDHCED